MTLDKGIAPSPSIAKNPRCTNLFSVFCVKTLIRYKNTTIVINNWVTNHRGHDRSNWCPLRKGVIKKFLRFISSPQNTPVNLYIKIVTRV